MLARPYVSRAKKRGISFTNMVLRLARCKDNRIPGTKAQDRRIPILISLEGKMRWKSRSRRTSGNAYGKLTGIMWFDLLLKRGVADQNERSFLTERIFVRRNFFVRCLFIYFVSIACGMHTVSVHVVWNTEWDSKIESFVPFPMACVVRSFR